MTTKNNPGSPGLKDCIATVTSSGYIPATLVMIGSFLEHNHWFTGDIVIIHDNLPEEDRDLLSCFKNIIFLQVSEALNGKLETLNQEVPERGLGHKFARFYSLEAFRLTGYRKVLFLDSDMLILDDLGHLFDMPHVTDADRLMCCGDRCYHFNGKRDTETFNPLFTPEEIGAAKETFNTSFNSGFMLIDRYYLDGTHYRNMLEILSPHIWRKVRSPLTDQLVLNHYFRDNVHILSGKYNFVLLYPNQILKRENLSPEDIKVIHFAGRMKPWNPEQVFKLLKTDASIIRYVRLWNQHYLEFLPHFHLQYQCMHHTLVNRKKSSST